MRLASSHDARGLIRTLLLGLAAATAQDQDHWLTKPVRLIGASLPGGGTDAYARILAQALSEALKQQFVVDKRPGGAERERMRTCTIADDKDCHFSSDCLCLNTKRGRSQQQLLLSPLLSSCPAC